ncbi:MAG: M48 family metalloprotease [Paracoccaceae bacterium]
MTILARPAARRLLLAPVLAFALLGCTPPPGTPPDFGTAARAESQRAPVVRTGEVQREAGADRAGAEANEAVLARFGGPYDDRRLQAYVDDIGERLVAVSAQPNERWSFTVLDTEDVNAFATTGGYVYVTRGLVALADDEAELAGVVGHEIAHITLGHRDARERRSTIAGVGTALGTIGAAVLGIDPRVAGGVLQTAAGGFVASYSREDEREADRLGIRYLADAGYDPEAQADFLQSLARHAELEAAKAGRRYDPNSTGFFATHPATGSRVEDARAIARQYAPPGTGQRGRDSHLAAIDGMAYGPSAAQGFVSDGRFVHPELDFSFAVPRGWQVQNTPSAVVMTDGARRVIFDGGRPQTGDPVDYLTEVWAPSLARETRTGRLRDVERLRIDGEPAARGAMLVEIDGRPWVALLTAIGRGGDQIWRFTTLVPRGEGGLDTGARVAQSFRDLDAAERRLGGQRRLDVVGAGGASAESLARRMAVENRALDTFRVLNDLDRGERLPARVKLVR